MPLEDDPKRYPTAAYSVEGVTESIARSVASSAGSPPERRFQVTPESVDLYTPTAPPASGCPFAAASAGNPPARVTAAYMMFGDAGLITIREKHRPANVC